MCFQLFAKEHADKGQAVRREGSGGDAGLEGYIADPSGCAIIGVQAKFFPEKFNSGQWRQIDESVRTALKDNSVDGSLACYVIATPREFNKPERSKWEQYRTEWTQIAAKTGYLPSPKFIHWGSSFLESVLKEDKNRGQLLYWFDYPHFHIERCGQLTHATIEQLGDRYIPGLHTPTECEDRIHTFLRTERFRKTYVDETRQALQKEQLDGLATEAQWPPQRQELLVDCRKHWRKFIEEFGDGVGFPASFARLGKAGGSYHERRLKLCNGLWEEIQKQPDLPPDQEGRKPETPLEKDVRSLNRNGEMFQMHVQRLQRDYSLADLPFLLVSGDAGNGKSHTLAEICCRYTDSGGVVLFVDGRQFPSDDPPWDQFLKWADFTSGGIRDFLACLSSMAATSPLPGLICIDALNETPHRGVWLNGLEKFAAELQPYLNLKLLVSCRTDYLKLTVPENVRQQKAAGWRHVRHQGLGLNVFEAVPKYLRAYQVKGVGVTPLTPEFARPLMLKTFCEAFEDEEPPPGTLSLPRILKAYVDRKSKNIAAHVGCTPSVALDALRDITATMLSSATLQLPERDVRKRLLSFHAQAEESKSLYRALLSEGILAEFPGADSLGPINLVRFTFERVWDYLLSWHLLPVGTVPNDQLKACLDDSRWRLHHPGLVQMLAIRLPEEGHGEIVDIIKAEANRGWDIGQAFVASIPWRTVKSWSARTEELFNQLCAQSSWTQVFEHSLPLSTNPEHPRNADWLHAKLRAIPFGKRDCEWTIRLNRQFSWETENGPVVRVIRLAETCDVALLNRRQLLLLATTLAWMLTTTAVARRNQISFALARLIRNDTTLTSELVERFMVVDDPYVVERVLFAAASAAVHAQHDDSGLASFAAVVHSAIFNKESVQPNVIIRHYASVICEQAMEKGVLDAGIEPESFRPPFRSVWPSIWSEADEEALEASFNSDWEHKRPLGSVISSTCTEQMGGYGDWGRYVMGGKVSYFQNRRLSEEPSRKWSYTGFDDRIARRYVLQRLVELGIAKQSCLDVRPLQFEGRERPSIERLGKKYQWIAMHEFLGYLSDHYHMKPDWEGEPPRFESVRQLSLPDLLDPFIWSLDEATIRKDWEFVQRRAPWWARYPHPFPRVLTRKSREKLVITPNIVEPTSLLRNSHEKCEWIALSGYFHWQEPAPCFARDRWDVLRAFQAWLFNSYAVPEAVLGRFVAKMTDPVLNGNMLPRGPEFRSEVLTLLNYPDSVPGLAEDCGHTFARTKGAWFTACDYSDEQDGSRSLTGDVPSPLLAKMLELKWTKSGLDFYDSDPLRPVVRDVREEDNHACLCQLRPLLAAFSKRGLRLVWRLYGWKWIGGTLSRNEPQREYWSLYSLSPLGKRVCLGGGTWLVRPNPVQEALPWPADAGHSTKPQGGKPKRLKSS